MSANDLILNSPLFRLTSEQRAAITSAQQRPHLRSIVQQVAFTKRDLADIQRLEDRRLRKSPFLQKLKFTGEQTVALKKIEEARATQSTPNVANLGFVIDAENFVNEQRRSENLAAQQLRDARTAARESLKVTPAFIDGSKIKIHGDISPETLVTLRRKGIV